MPSSDLLTHVSKKLITYLTEFAEFKDGIYCFVSIVSLYCCASGFYISVNFTQS